MSEATQKREAQGRRQSPMSARGHERRFHDVRDRSVHTPVADIPTRRRNGREGPILLQKSLAISVNGDSVALMRFAMEAIDDGAAQSRPR